MKMFKTKKVPLARNPDWFEIRRKLFHIFSGLIIVSLIYFDLLKWWMMLLVLISGFIVSLIYRRWKIPVIHWFLKTFERPHHIEELPGRGALSIGLGVLLSMILFEKNICLAALMIWTLGDSISALVGKHFGNKIHPLNDERLIEGTIAGIFAGTISAMLFVNFYAALVASIVSMSLESIELKLMHEPIDDNILVPLISGGCLILMKILTGI